MYNKNVVCASGENFIAQCLSMGCFLMISYFTTFVYHILINHFCYLPGFIKKNYILFSKESHIFVQNYVFR